MHVSEKGLRLIEQFEGFVGHPYWDPYGHVWTRGYGETEGITAASPTISQEQAQGNLRRRLEEFYEPSIRALGVELNQNQWDALCSFAWNVGSGDVAPGSQIGNLLRAHRWEAAADAMLAYDHAGGQVLQDLVMRRQTERALFLTPVADPLAVLLPKERQEVDRLNTLELHPHLHGHGIAVVKARLVVFRKAIWLAAERGVLPDGKPTAKGWEVADRARRYQILLARTR